MIEPAGLMWSVVTESPKIPSARAPRMSPRLDGRHPEAVEERRLGDVRRRGPVVDLAGGAGDRAPQRIGVGDVAVESAVDRRVLRVAHHRGDLVRRRPEILEVDRAVLADPDRLGREVAQHRAGDRVRDDQRRGGEEVRLEVRMDPGLEVAVARKDRRTDEIVGGDRFVEFLPEVAGIADAGRAAVRGDAEAELLEVGQEAGLGQVVGDDARAGRERGLDVRLAP